jgi:hypothetical protein
MSRFTTRVELYGNPSYEVYNSLHEAMQKKGFSRKIQLSNVVYWLPNAEYTMDSTQTTQQVVDLAKSAAASVWQDFGVMVTKTEVDRGYHNLKKA